MAVKVRRITRPQSELNMSTISDIVFLLLIYFMVVTVFQQDIGMPFVLPAATEQEDIIKIKESNTATIEIGASNVITLQGIPITVNALKRDLETRLTENPRLVVIVQNHPMSDYGVFAAVLDEIRLAQCRRVALKMMEV